MQTHLNLHQDAQQYIHLDHPAHVEDLARHLFKDSPKGMNLIEKTFGKKPLPTELPPRAPVNRLMSEPYSAG